MTQPLPCYRIRYNHRCRQFDISRRVMQWPSNVCFTAWEARFHLLDGAPVVYLIDSQLAKFRGLK